MIYRCVGRRLRSWQGLDLVPGEIGELEWSEARIRLRQQGRGKVERRIVLMKSIRAPKINDWITVFARFVLVEEVVRFLQNPSP